MMTVTLGASFEVALGSGASTGYTWELLAPHDGMALVSSGFREQAGAAIGDGGSQFFELRALRVGRAQLSFVRKRRWEQAAIDSRVIDIDVVANVV
jgi:inhibitor of cysteine peptidase